MNPRIEADRAAKRCVLLFARTPEGEERAKSLPRCRALFERTRDRVASAAASLADVDLLVAGQPASGAPSGSARFIPQRGGSFGERLLNAFNDARALGYREVVAVSTDVPTLGWSHLAASFRALESHDVVLGRSPDGGVYLIGSRIEVGQLFRGVPWRTSGVFRRLRDNLPDDEARGPGGILILEDVLSDVDGMSDLIALREKGRLDPEMEELLRWLLAPAPFQRDESSRAGSSPLLPLLADARAPPRQPLAS